MMSSSFASVSSDDAPGVPPGRPIVLNSGGKRRAFVAKDGTGAMFKREAKDSGPAYLGDIRVGSELFTISAFERQGKYSPFLSLSLKLKGRVNSAGELVLVPR